MSNQPRVLDATPVALLGWGGGGGGERRQRVHIGGLVLGHSDGLLSAMCACVMGGGGGEGTLNLSDSIRYLANTVVTPSVI